MCKDRKPCLVCVLAGFLIQLNEHLFKNFELYEHKRCALGPMCLINMAASRRVFKTVSFKMSASNTFPPVTSDSLLRHYLPIAPSCDLFLSNALLFNAHFGVGVYCYFRRHMKKLSTNCRVMYSVYEAVLFNFGSVLLWAVMKVILPPDTLIRTTFGVLTSVCLLGIGKEYLAFIEENSTTD
uniref:Uncharacterized protein n=1 Tax=Romanomermis culicivorax TaxID=13658 RepID=A0A915JVU6_ROMCU